MTYIIPLTLYFLVKLIYVCVTAVLSDKILLAKNQQNCATFETLGTYL